MGQLALHALDAAGRKEADSRTDRGQLGDQRPHRVPVHRRLMRQRRAGRRGIGSRRRHPRSRKLQGDAVVLPLHRAESAGEVPNEDIFSKLPGWTEEAQGRALDEMQLRFGGVAEQFRDSLRRTPDPDKAMTIKH